MNEAVEALVLLGLDEETAQRAVADNRVPLALVSKFLARRQVLSLEEAAERSGVPAEYLRERDRVLGIPPTQGFDTDEVEELGELANLLDLVAPQAVLRWLRADSPALTAIAMSSLQLVREQLADPVREAGGNDLAVAVTFAEAARTLLPVAGMLVGSPYRRIVEHLISTELIAVASRGDRSEVDLAVGFVDVVGYTSLAARIDPEGLDEVLEAFESRCYAAAAAHDSVQLVKFLGDAGMYVSVAPAPLAGVLLDIVTAEDEEGPLAGEVMRAGMAYGSVLQRGGDFFGQAVNLAARLTDRARSGSLLADDGLDEELAEFSVRKVPPLRLRGVGVRRPLRVRRPSPRD